MTPEAPAKTPANTPAKTPEKAPEREQQRVRDPGWDVIVWNDPITLMSYVVLVLRRLFGHDHATATRLMLQVHHEGKAVVARQPREQAEVSVSRLHSFGLNATLTRGS